MIQKRKPPETAHKKPKKDFGQEELKRKTEEVRDRINDMICVASCSELEVILEKLAKTSSLKLINDISQVLDGLFEESKIRALQQDLEWLVTEGWDEGRAAALEAKELAKQFRDKHKVGRGHGGRVYGNSD